MSALIFLKSLYLQKRFYILLLSIAFIFAVSFVLPWLFIVAQILFVVFWVLFIVDMFMLYKVSDTIEVERRMAAKLSLYDENPIKLLIKNYGKNPLQVGIIDELPFQLQKRDFMITATLPAGGLLQSIEYHISPKKRGVYEFGKIHFFIQLKIRFLEMRKSKNLTREVAVYPSIIQMKKYELMAMSSIMRTQGVRKLRRIGHSYEFEQIKNYVRGDDYRSINWKATSRRGELMINQFQEERSQRIYVVIDKSRSMRMPFNGLTLLDYAINSALVILNVSLQKGDRAGLINFSKEIDFSLRAEQKSGQLRKILEALYRIETDFPEANYEHLYQHIRRQATGRSLLFLFSNFESFAALERSLPVLRRLNKQHLLIVVFFENSELSEFAYQQAEDLEGIYERTIAQKFTLEKQRMVSELKAYNIQYILTKPEELSINSINKYLEIKAKGLL
ncbi:MAG: DUF58 domain-containing protein [Bernardetiaceae bacterium]|nr:DUF58 domain-containing protein [Bernardetiaceae bacterium]